MGKVSLRQWQAECEAEFASSGHPDFLVNALPGAGKTVAAGIIIRRQFLEANPSGLILLTVPTDHMRSQWIGVMSRLFGIELTSEVTARISPPFRGLVTTYAGLAKNAETIRFLASRFPSLAVNDEVHHAGDRASWGLAIASALEPAMRRLHLSGTPFRHDEARIPFLRTQETAAGLEYVADYTYEFSRALAEGVVRSVRFQTFDGLARYVEKGFQISQFLSEAPAKDLGLVLRVLLNDEGYLERILGAAHRRLLEQRSRVGDAGGLAIAIDTEHAKLVASVLERITGEEPSIVVSDDMTATSSVKAFAADPRRRWVVAVRMISEGVDVPRLMTLALVTNVKTRLYFRQAVGRVVRRRGETDPLCDVFMPAAADLVSHAREIERACQQAAEPSPIDMEPVEEAAGVGGGGRPQRDIEVLGVENVGAKETVFRGLQEALEFDYTGAASVDLPPVPLEERMEALRSEITGLVRGAARASGLTAHQMNRLYLTSVCKTPQAKMSLEQLTAKADWLKRRLGRSAAVLASKPGGVRNG